MLSKEQGFVLNVLSDHINGRDTALIEGLDEDVVLTISKQQQCKAIIYHQTRLPSFKAAAKSNFYHYVNRNNLLCRIDELFTQNEIPYFIFKGSEIANLYPIPQLRTMGDSDILVHEEDRERAHKILIEIGLVNTCKGGNEWIYQHKKFKLELHCRLMNEGEAGNSQAQKDFMNRRWDYAVKEKDSYKYHLDYSYHFVFVISHLRKHFINSGVGFRQFADVAVMIKNCQLDWSFIMCELEKMELTQFALTCFAFCEKWFGITVPVEVVPIDDAFYSESTEKIFKNGVFGFDDKDNIDNYEILQDIKYGKPKIIRNIIFPPYEEMTALPEYSFLSGKKWLLPAAWFYRFMRSVLHGSPKTCVSNINYKLNIDGKQIKARSEFLEKWGL